MRSSLYIIAVITTMLWILCTDVAPVWAKADIIKVENLVDHYTLHVKGQRPAVLTFGSAILFKIDPIDSDKVTVELAATKDTITVYPAPGLEAGEDLGLVYVGTRLFTLIIHVVATTGSDPVKTAYHVEHKHLLDVMRMAAEKIAEEQIAEAENRLQASLVAKASEHAEEIAVLTQQYGAARALSGEFALLREHHGHTRTVELKHRGPCEVDGKLAICGRQWHHFGEHGILRVILSNGTPNEVKIADVIVYGQGSTEDRASSIRVGDGEPMGKDAIATVIGPMQSVPVSIVVRGPASVGRHVQLLVTGPGIRPAMEYIDLRPKEGEGLITLGLQGIGGAIWLANPVDTQDLGATSTTGLGLRVRYGINRLVSFEAELAGARTGNASFQGTMGGEQGEISRNATLGRVLAGGMLHFGDKYKPFVRAGLGFQGVDHGSRFTPTTGEETSGPDVGFEVAGIWAFGLGLDARLGEHWTAGLGVTFVRATSLSGEGTSGSLEGGLHLSYGWTPFQPF